MRKAIHQVLVFSFILLFVVTTGCRKGPSKAELANINLLRGDVTLCGGDNFGEINWTVRCKASALPTFKLGVSLLHSFEYDEAEKAFVNVIDEDPECAMAYWGVAMANFHALWLQAGTDYLVKGAQIIKAAASLEKTEMENDYLYAISGFYENFESVPHAKRVSLFAERMKSVYEKYPEDKEAAIFYALALTASADPADKTYRNQLASGKILESIYPDQPNHPGIAHYLIHNYDYPELAERAVATARRYADIAPASAHAQHMPTHIFTRLGFWDECIQSNLRSTQAALCYGQTIDSTGHWDEELHGMDYLVYAYLQEGDNLNANAQLDYLLTFRKEFPMNFKVAYAAAAIPTRIALENKNWEEASQLELPDIGVDWDKFPWQRSIVHFGKAMGAVHTGDLALAEEELTILQTNQKILLDNNNTYQANQVGMQADIVKAWLAHAKGHDVEALTMMKAVTDRECHTAKHPVTPGEVLPAGELLGDLFIELSKPGEAMEAYETDLLQHPNRLNGMYGAAKSAMFSGNKEKAKKYFTLVVKQAKQSPRKEIEEARHFLQTI